VKLFVSTADASGDLHAAALLEALRAHVPGLRAQGLGGQSLIAAGLAPVVDQAELAVAGLVEVLGSAPRVLRAYRRLRRALLESQPEVALLVDSPDLNLPLAGAASRAGIPVLYYIAPQVWAWRWGRVRKLAGRTRGVGVIFPFEEPLLRAAGVNARFVGHPLVDRMARVRARLQPKEAARELGLDLERPVLGLLPGSRRNEVAANLPAFLESAELLRAARPELQVQLIAAPTLAAQRWEVGAGVRIVRERGHEAMALSTCLLSAPGTATVEAALLGVPLVVAHRVHPLTFELARRVLRVPSSCMINLIAEEGVVTERLQEQVRPTALAAELGRLLSDPEARAALRRRLEQAAARLGPPGAAERAARFLLEVAGRG
jgi:lipid-A-disaccharide synthase